MAAHPRRIGWLVAFTVICVVAALIAPSFPQPPGYHGFIDRRAVLGIANFGDVASNVGFLVSGLLGLALVFGGARFEEPQERWPWAAFFLGLVLTAFGSAYYHLAPDNERLFWDRVPITIALMALVSAQIVDRISIRAGVALLAPLLLVGIASVVYWRATERAGSGNLVPYVVLQGYAVVILLCLALALPSRYTRGRDLLWIFGWYALAKVFEVFDERIFRFGNVLSGHTLKHIAAGMAGFVACWMLARRAQRRRVRESAV